MNRLWPGVQAEGTDRSRSPEAEQRLLQERELSPQVSMCATGEGNGLASLLVRMAKAVTDLITHLNL